jgi:SAM-dependent methyltransferase
MTLIDTATRCPLCESESSTRIDAISYDDVWRQLGDIWGARFSAAVVARHSPGPSAILVECSNCGLRYFIPSNPGDADFYRELSSSSRYYAPYKWEFGFVRDRWCHDRAVLDVGCGDGQFLRLLNGVADRAVGVETNPDAVSEARNAGLDVRLCAVESLADEQPENFDVVCSFHVLEHLPHLRSYIAGMVACLKPGGLLIVSVPNRLRTIDPAVPEPLDSPPHHISRWHPDQLRMVAKMFDLDVVAIEFDPPTLADCREHVRVAVVRRLRGIARGRFLDKVIVFISRALGRMLFPSFAYRFAVQASLIERMGIYRQNMLAVLRKKDVPSSRHG